jgi:hypothetical protein
MKIELSTYNRLHKLVQEDGVEARIASAPENSPFKFYLTKSRKNLSLKILSAMS